MESKSYIKPGFFSENVADSKRLEFDVKNQVLIQNSKTVDFVFAGDSITQGWELNAYFNKPGQLIINRGIGGDITKYMCKRFVADVAQLKPMHCILMIGVNDAWDLQYDHFRRETPKTTEAVLKNAANNIFEIAKVCKERYINLIICSVLPTNMHWTSEDGERKKYIVALNNYLKRLCEENSLIYVDYHSKMVKEDGLTIIDNITTDGLHPDVFGYNIMADVLRETLCKYNIEM